MSVRVRLEPLGITLAADRGVPLADLLFPHGVEFPCGGRGTCRGCRVRISGGAVAPTREERGLLSASELAGGWRLACRTSVTGDLTIEVAQWSAPVLADEQALACRSRSGLGVAVDVGTTTLVAQLVDLGEGRVIGVRTALNPQGVFGGDIMTRVQAALAPAGARRLRDVVRDEVARMVRELCADGPAGASAACTRVMMSPPNTACGFKAVRTPMTRPSPRSTSCATSVVVPRPRPRRAPIASGMPRGCSSASTGTLHCATSIVRSPVTLVRHARRHPPASSEAESRPRSSRVGATAPPEMRTRHPRHVPRPPHGNSTPWGKRRSASGTPRSAASVMPSGSSRTRTLIDG